MGVERVRSLGNGDLYAGYVDLRAQPFCDLGRVRRFEEELQGLYQVALAVFHSVALAGNIELGTEGNVGISLSFDHRGQTADSSHLEWLPDLLAFAAV